MEKIEESIKEKMANLGNTDRNRAREKLEETKRLKVEGKPEEKVRHAAVEFLEILESGQ